MTLKWTQIDLKETQNGPKIVQMTIVSLFFCTPLFMLEIAQKWGQKSASLFKSFKV